MKQTITVQVTIDAPVNKVWKLYTTPEDIKQWNNATEDWFTPRAENDLKASGKFNFRMEARDGSIGFDFWGIYDEVKPNELIKYTIGDERKVKVTFTKEGNKTKVVVDFEAENTNSIEMQKNGWQSILNNFKKYVESH